MKSCRRKFGPEKIDADLIREIQLCQIGALNLQGKLVRAEMARYIEWTDELGRIYFRQITTALTVEKHLEELLGKLKNDVWRDICVSF